jgi:hypothetical protein
LQTQTSVENKFFYYTFFTFLAGGGSEEDHLCHPSFSRDEVIAVIAVMADVAVVTVVTAVAAVAHPVGVVTTGQQQSSRILLN